MICCVNIHGYKAVTAVILLKKRPFVILVSRSSCLISPNRSYRENNNFSVSGFEPRFFDLLHFYCSKLLGDFNLPTVIIPAPYHTLTHPLKLLHLSSETLPNPNKAQGLSQLLCSPDSPGGWGEEGAKSVLSNLLIFLYLSVLTGEGKRKEK